MMADKGELEIIADNTVKLYNHLHRKFKKTGMGCSIEIDFSKTIFDAAVKLTMADINSDAIVIAGDAVKKGLLDISKEIYGHS